MTPSRHTAAPAVAPASTISFSSASEASWVAAPKSGGRLRLPRFFRCRVGASDSLQMALRIVSCPALPHIDAPPWFIVFLGRLANFYARLDALVGVGGLKMGASGVTRGLMTKGLLMKHDAAVGLGRGHKWTCALVTKADLG